MLKISLKIMGYASMQMLFAGKPRKTRKKNPSFWYIESLYPIIPLFKSFIKISIKNRRVSYRIHTFNRVYCCFQLKLGANQKHLRKNFGSQILIHI